MENLTQIIAGLKESPVKSVVDARIKEFKSKKTVPQLFSELSYCVMTAGFRADKSLEIQKKVGEGFLTLPEKVLQEKLKEYGYRYHNRASYIVYNRQFAEELDGKGREWLAKNIKGFGMKEASHYLRNIGQQDVAIIDFHIIDVLAKYEIIQKPKTKTLSSKTYIEIEKILENISKKVNLTLAELDLYLWYMETGKILK